MVAKRAGVSKGLVFNYFATKDDLLAAIIRRRLTDQLAFWKDHEVTGPAATRLRAIIDRSLENVIAYPDAHRLYFSLLLQPGASKPVQDAVEAMKPAVAEYYLLIESLFRELGAPAPRAAAFAFQGALTGLAHTLTIQPALAKRPDIFPLEGIKDELMTAFGNLRTKKAKPTMRDKRKGSR
jgi:AcrR family transcriptional regulator